jgi:hypothetical protein
MRFAVGVGHYQDSTLSQCSLFIAAAIPDAEEAVPELCGNVPRISK